MNYRHGEIKKRRAIIIKTITRHEEAIIRLRIVIGEACSSNPGSAFSFCGFQPDRALSRCRSRAGRAAAESAADIAAADAGRLVVGGFQPVCG